MLESKKFEDFQKEANQYKNILLDYKKNGKPFVDNNFHPKLKIHEYKVSIDDSPESWVRVDDMYDAPLFQENLIHPDFISQGELGDCYFVASLSRIARQSYLISSLFDTTTPTRILGSVQDSINIKCGAVVVYFNCFGRRTPVLIDTLLPLKYDQLRFSSPKDKSQSPWFCLVEKAYAKLNGSYSNIIGGNLPLAIYNMFGYYPSLKEVQKWNIPEKLKKVSLFERIMKYQEQGAVMGASITVSNLPKGVTKEEVDSKGLIKDHCYLIIKAREASNKQFICLRNPWGSHEWNGDWSDDSPLWTPQLMKELKFVKGDDGTFWMSEKDFFRYFSDIEVSKPFPPEWYSKRFYCQMLPGDHDGADPHSPTANLASRPNFAFQVTQPLKKGEKCRFHVLIEKHNQLFDSNTNSEFDDPLYCVFLVHNKGMKIDPDNLPYCDRITVQSKSNLFTLSHEVYGNEDIVTIVLQRLVKCNLIEDCYVLVFCDHEFNLYEIGKPDEVFEYEENPGIVFNNFSSRYPDARKMFKLKMNGNGAKPSKSGLKLKAGEGNSKSKNANNESTAKQDENKNTQKDQKNNSPQKQDENKSTQKQDENKSTQKQDENKSTQKNDEISSPQKHEEIKSTQRQEVTKSSQRQEVTKITQKQEVTKRTQRQEEIKRRQKEDSPKTTENDAKSRQNDDSSQGRQKEVGSPSQVEKDKKTAGTDRAKAEKRRTSSGGRQLSDREKQADPQRKPRNNPGLDSASATSADRKQKQPSSGSQRSVAKGQPDPQQRRGRAASNLDSASTTSADRKRRQSPRNSDTVRSRNTRTSSNVDADSTASLSRRRQQNNQPARAADSAASANKRGRQSPRESGRDARACDQLRRSKANSRVDNQSVISAAKKRSVTPINSRLAPDLKYKPLRNAFLINSRPGSNQRGTRARSKSLPRAPFVI